MKELDYTNHRIKLLFIAGIVLVFLILFTSFLFPRQLKHNYFKPLKNKFGSRLTINLGGYLNKNNNSLYDYGVSNSLMFNKQMKIGK